MMIRVMDGGRRKVDKDPRKARERGRDRERQEETGHQTDRQTDRLMKAKERDMQRES